MSIIDKANEYVGHPREVDEGYEVSMRRTAYAQGYQDAIEKACEWIKANMLNYVNFEEGFIYEVDMSDDFRKAMEE